MAKLHQPFLQPSSSSGVLSGAKLYFYQAGTTTDITTYQDSGTVTPHAQPVVADADGIFAPIWVATSSYKTVLKTSAGVTVQTVDNIDGTSASNTEFADDTFRLQDNLDATKELQFQISGLTTGTLRTWTVQDVNGTVYVSGGTDISLADGGTGASLADPNADRIMFWDDSAGAVTWLTAGNGLTITTTSIAVNVATQAEQETATATTAFVTPANQQYHPGHPKCWAFVSVSAGVPSLTTSYNITSVTDSGVGDLLITIATDFSGATWTGLTSVNTGSSTTMGNVFGTKAAGTIQILLYSAGAGADPVSWNFVGFGDQA